MSLFFRKFKRSVKKSIALALAGFIMLLCIIFSDFLIMQAKHAYSFYFVYKGDECYKDGQLQQAIDNYNKALYLFPEHVKAQYNLGNIYVTYEDYNSAVTCYEKALNVYPDYINARVNLGIILSQELLDFDRAIEEYKKAVSAKPLIIKIPYIYNNGPQVRDGKAYAYYNLGLAYRSKSLLYGVSESDARDYLEKAAESYRNSLKFLPNSYNTHYNLALTLHLLGYYTQAMVEYCKAINIAPLNYEAHYNFALLLKEKRNYRESIQELEKAGIILDANGEFYKTRYIYNVLNEVSQRVLAQNGYKYLTEKINHSSSQNRDLTYIGGKVVTTEELEKAVIDNMKECNSCKMLSD